MADVTLSLSIERSVARPLPTDAETLAVALLQVADGDRRAFEEVYRRTAMKLFGICLQIVPKRAEAEDALQEVYCSVWRSAGMFDPRRGTAMTWLMTIARNRAVDRARLSKKSVLVSIEAASAVPDPRPLAFETIAVDDEHRRMRRCLDLLSKRDASVLKAAFFGGSTYTDLAQSTGLPIGTIKSRMRRALLQLRNNMTEA